MPEFKIPRIVRPLDLSGFAPELVQEIAEAPPPFLMWVNPHLAVQERLAGLQDEQKALAKELSEAVKRKAADEELKALAERLSALNIAVAAWWAEVWSQGPDPETHWTAEQVKAFQLRCAEEDPALWEFVVRGCWALVREHRESARKN